MTEEHIVDIDIKIAYLEEAVDELNRVALKQEDSIRDLLKLTAQLAAKLKTHSVALSDDLPEEERPPHY